MCAKNFTNIWDLQMYRIKLRIKILSNIQEKTEDKETYVRRVWEVKQQMLAAMPKVSSYKYKYHTSKIQIPYWHTYKHKIPYKGASYVSILQQFQQCDICIDISAMFLCLSYCNLVYLYSPVGVQVSFKLAVHTVGAGYQWLYHRAPWWYSD